MADITILQALGLIALSAMAGGLLEWAALRQRDELAAPSNKARRGSGRKPSAAVEGDIARHRTAL